MKKILLSVLLGALPGIAQAHYLWLEPAAGGAALYYGEMQNGVTETSPGALDKMLAVRAQPQAGGAVSGVAQGDHVFYALPAGAVTVVQDALPVRAGHADPRMSKTVFHARLAQGGAALPLDLVQSGNTVQVLFDGKPLPKASVTLYSENGWQRALRADADGRVDLALPWPGRYVLHVKHSLDAPGEFDGKAYAVKNLITTLSLVRP
jgi:hypothetical protein